MSITVLTTRRIKGKPHNVKSIACVFLFSLACAMSANGAESYTAEAMWKLKRLAAPAISPDGRLAVVAVTTYDISANKGDSDLWLVPTKTGKPRQLTSGPSGDSQAAWSPDGTLIAFASKRGEDKESQIYVIPVDGGEARRVTNVPSGVSSPKWFPDSRRIAFITPVWKDLKTWAEQEQRQKERADSKMSALVWDKAPFSYWDHFLDDREPHVFAVGIEGGEPKPITLSSGHSLDVGDADETSFDISPDGTEIAFSSNTDTSGRDPNFDIYVMPTDGGEARNLTADNPADDSTPTYSPDGRLLAFRRQLIKDFYADRARLMLHERRAGTTRGLTDDWDRSANGLVWAPDSHALFGTIEDAGTRRVYRFDVAKGGSGAA